MGTLDSIFGKKKHSEPKKTKARTVEAEAQAIPTLMYYERSSLQKYVDTKMPVLIIGGKYNQKQVVLTSNPKYKSYTHNGHNWPCATIEKVTSEEPEPVRYIGTKPAKQEQLTEVKQEEEVKPEVKDISEAFNFNEIKDKLPHFLIPDQERPTFREDFDKYSVLYDRLERVLCPRVHFKMLVFDSKEVYVGSANLTGAGIGMKGEDKRNFEAGILTDAPEIVEQAMNQFDEVWIGLHCKKCKRREYCIDPIV